MWASCFRMMMMMMIGSSQAWFVNNGTVYYNESTPFALRGLNWFGYETNCHIVHGLWVNALDHFFWQLSEEIQVNALRIPFSLETILEWESPPRMDCLTANPWLHQVSIKDSLHILFQKASEAHIAILLDFHSIGGDITDYLVSDSFTLEDALIMWKKILDEFAQYDNLLGIDIKNEPHGDISWEEWGSYTSSIVTFIRTQFPHYRGLFFIEGIQDRSSHSVWGGSFTGLHKRMMTILPNNKVVFSPHVYGNSIRGDSANEDTYALFDHWFGHLRFKFPQNAIVIGEIGGMNIGDDLLWHKKIKNYLKRRDIRDAFYWCLNPNSYDTGGILQYDWQTVDPNKLSFQRDLQPDRTIISFSPPIISP